MPPALPGNHPLNLTPTPGRPPSHLLGRKKAFQISCIWQDLGMGLCHQVTASFLLHCSAFTNDRS
jgi:hypothetical protein